MHYRDGTAAQLGDIARGKGYNLPYKVQGVVVGLSPGTGSCDIHVAVLVQAEPVGLATAPYPAIIQEHGTCAEFVRVHPAVTVARPLP